MSRVRSILPGGLRRLITAGGPLLGLAFIVSVFIAGDLLTDAQGAFGPDGSLEKFGRIVTSYNLRLIAAQTTIIAIGALGMTIVIISGGIDLSAGSTIALVTVVVALALDGAAPGAGGDAGLGPTLAVAIGLGAGALVGLLNGALITGLGIVPFIATLGMMSMARGLAKLLAGEQKISAGETWISGLLHVDPSPGVPVWSLPSGTLVLAALALLTWALLRYTVFGRRVFAIGSNEETAVLCGIRVERQKLWIYTLAGLFVAVAALMQFSEGNSGDPTSAVGKELDIIAAVVIGGGSLSGGKGSVPGTLIGAFIIGLLRNGCVLYDIPNTVQEIVIGAIIVSAAAVDRFQERRRGRA